MAPQVMPLTAAALRAWREADAAIDALPDDVSEAVSLAAFAGLEQLEVAIRDAYATEMEDLDGGRSSRCIRETSPRGCWWVRQIVVYRFDSGSAVGAPAEQLSLLGAA